MKKFIIALAMVVGIFILPTVVFSEIFEMPAEVRLSGDVNGKITFTSNDPAALDLIDGVVQFCNDTMKQRGWGMINNAFRPAERISPNMLVIKLFEGTLKTQFSFNVKNGELWGLIPSCMLVPDGRTIVVENSAPSLNNNGGHHFSLIAHLTDSSYYRVAANIMPCPNGMSASNVSATSPIITPVVQGPAPVVASMKTEVQPKKTPALAPAKISPPPVVKKPAVAPKKCDPCIAEAVAPVKADTEAIKASVGEATSEEKTAGLGDLHNKATRQLAVAEETRAAVEKVRESSLTVGDKIGIPAEKDDTLFSLLEKVEKQTSPKERSFLEKAKDLWWLWLILIAGSGYYLYRLRRQENQQQPPTPAAQPQAGANQ